MRKSETIGLTEELNKTYLATNKRVDLALTKFNITGPQYAVLATLEEIEIMTNAELARRCGVTPQTMIRIAKNMIRSGLLHQFTDPENKLKIYYKLTKKAEKIVCSAHVEINKIELKMIRGLSKLDLKKFNEIVGLFRKNLTGE